MINDDELQNLDEASHSHVRSENDRGLSFIEGLEGFQIIDKILKYDKEVLEKWAL